MKSFADLWCIPIFPFDVTRRQGVEIFIYRSIIGLNDGIGCIDDLLAMAYILCHCMSLSDIVAFR